MPESSLRMKVMVDDSTVASSTSTCCVRGDGVDVERLLVGDGGVAAEVAQILAAAVASSTSCLLLS